MTNSENQFKYIPLSIRLETKGGIASPLIHRGTPLPTTRKEVFSTAEDNQTSVEISLWIGESPITKNNRKIGVFQLKGIPNAKAGEPQIIVIITVDKDLTVSAQAKLEGSKIKIEKNLDTPTLTNELVQKILEGAERQSERDEAEAKRIELINRSNSLIKKAEENLALSENQKINIAVANLGLALDSGDPESILKRANSLEMLLLFPEGGNTIFDLFSSPTSSSQEENKANSESRQKKTKAKPEVTDEELITAIEAQRNLMIAVATGGPRINDVNQDYIDRREFIANELRKRGLRDPNPHIDLWSWYGHWTSSDMPSWGSRRAYISEMYQLLTSNVKNGPRGTGAELFEGPVGWPRVDRGIDEIRLRLKQAQTEEQFQAVGLLCRETLISLAEVVFDENRHTSAEGGTISKTDAKRMLDAFIAVELFGGFNEGARRHAKAALNLANDLQHHRTAQFQQAALCAEATTSVINLIAIISGRRERE